MKYYWLKLDKNFFQQHDIRLIESMKKGKEILLFYIKLLAESVSHEGDLRFSDGIPYDNEMLAGITNTNKKVVDEAMEVFYQLGLVTYQDDETITMNEVKSLIGRDDSAAKSNRERQARYRERQKVTETVTEAVTEALRDVTSPLQNNVRDKSIEIRDNNIYSAETESVLEYLNQVCGTRYRSDASKKVIKARLEDKFTVDDCKTVVDKKYRAWKDDPKMIKFLRPETLFAKSHFESYLNEKDVVPGGKFNKIDSHNYDFNELERILT